MNSPNKHEFNIGCEDSGLFKKLLAWLPPRLMKDGYKLVFYIVLVVSLVLVVLSYLSLLGYDSQADRLVQILVACAVVVTAVISLSNADPKKRKITACIKCYIDPKNDKKEEYHKKDLSDELKEFYKDFGETFSSYWVQFEIENKSEFDWIKPIVTFRLPIEYQPPDSENSKKREDKLEKYCYRSNTFNSTADMKMLSMVDGIVISNSNLPYIQCKEHITVWIRMVLVEKKPFDVKVYVNCEDYDGFIQNIRVNPNELLKSVVESVGGNSWLNQEVN